MKIAVLPWHADAKGYREYVHPQIHINGKTEIAVRRTTASGARSEFHKRRKREVRKYVTLPMRLTAVDIFLVRAAVLKNFGHLKLPGAGNCTTRRSVVSREAREWCCRYHPAVGTLVRCALSGVPEGHSCDDKGVNTENAAGAKAKAQKYSGASLRKNGNAEIVKVP
jgi:hypothetical protein